MTVTQDYKTVTLSLRELVCIEFALQERHARLQAQASNGDQYAADLIDTTVAALAKIEAAL